MRLKNILAAIEDSAVIDTRTQRNKLINNQLGKQAREIVFLDTAIYDYQTLLSGIKAGIEVVILDNTKDGVEQITQTLLKHSFDSVHIVSHGSPGCLYLGNSQLNLTNLHFYAAQLQNWFSHLSVSNSPKLLIYGCNVAVGDAGTEFIERVHEATRVTIAASTTKVGHSGLGGNWELDFKVAKDKTVIDDVTLPFGENTLIHYAGVFVNPGDVVINEVAWMGTNADSSHEWIELYNNTDQEIDLSGWNLVGIGNNVVTIPDGQVIAAKGYFLLESNENAVNDINADYVYSGTLNDNGERLSLIIADNNETTVDTANNNGGKWPAGINFEGNPNVRLTMERTNPLNTGTDGNWHTHTGVGRNGTDVDDGEIYGTPKALNSVPTPPGITIIKNTTNNNLITTEDGERATFDIVLDTVPFADVTINLSSDDETEGTVSAEFQSLIFTPQNWDKAQTVTITGQNDDVYDEDVNYNIILEASTSSDQRYNGIDVDDIAVINEDNDILTVSITVIDGETSEAGNPVSKFRVTRNSTLGDLTVGLEIDSSSTLSQDDYQLVGNSLSTTSTSGLGVIIPDGQTSVDFELTPVDDTVPENDETLRLNIAASNIYEIDSSNSNATVTIIANDEISYGISGSSTEINEGNSGTQTLIFTVTRSGGIGVDSSVDYSINGTATLGSDYDNIQITGGSTAQNGTLNFAVGETQKTITVDVIGDDGFEVDETIRVVLSNPNPAIAPANSTITTDTAAVNVKNDDDQPVLSINGFSIAEGDLGKSTGNFQVSLSNPSTETVTVNYETTDDTASVDDGDYIAKSGTVTFQPGETIKEIDIEINGDHTFESEETFTLNLSNPDNAALSNDISTKGVGTIENDDNQPSISITDFSITEGDEGSQEITFNVSLSNPSGENISVDYSTSDDTAEANDNDYVAIENTTLVFEPGEISKDIIIEINGDIKSETDETFNINLSNATGATIAKGTGVGTIRNNDDKPSVSIDDITLAEGESKDFTVSLSNPSSEEITISYSSSDDTGTLQDSDYEFSSGNLFFAPGETSQTISFTTLDDDKFEDDETVSINLTSANGASIAKNQGTATITNNDEEPTITITGVEVSEGNTGLQEAELIVTLSNPSSKTITVDYQTSDDTANSTDKDYNPIPLSTLTFEPGEVEKSIKLEINSDRKFEESEIFNINLSNPSNATLFSDEPGMITIINDDGTPRLSIDDVSIAEGDNGIKKATFTVSLSNPSGENISVNYNTVDDSADALSGDYNSVTDTITFNPGEVSKNIEIEVNGDNTFEPDESFSVNLTSTDSVEFDKDTGFATIRNDDPQPTISVEDISVNEGEVAEFEITLSNPSSTDIILNYSTDDDTATTTDNDYISDSNSITFAAGETKKTIQIETTDDTKFEDNETFNLSLDNANGAIISDTRNLGRATINNNDTQPTISIEDVSVNEGEIAEFNITLSNPSFETITVNYQSEDGSATIPGNDYTSIQDTLTFAPDEVSKTISLETIGDNLFEGNETVNIKLSDTTNAAIADEEGIITIINNDERPTIDIQDSVSITEGNDGIQIATFNVTLSNPSSEVVSVSYSTQDDTATNTDKDYNPIQGKILTFQPGEINQTIQIEINGDTQFEDDENFNVVLSNPVGGVLNTDTGIVTIENDDQEPGISIEDVNIIEGETGNVQVSLTNTSSKAVTLNFSTSDDTATVDDKDYISITSQNIVFQPGETSKTISVSSNADNKFETDETFFINLDSAENATINDNTSIIGIINNDQIPTVSIQQNLDILEGNIDTSTATFKVTLSNPSSETIAVNYSTSDGSASTFDGDYNSVSDTLTFEPGEISKNISVDINGDTTFEKDEQFSVNLTNPSNVKIAQGKGTLTITNDDNQPTISVSDSTVNFTEGDGVISNAIIEVNLSQAAGVPVSFDYSTLDNTASSGSDYTETTGTITFQPGFDKQTINIPILGDFVDEGEESFSVNFSNVKNGTLVNNQIGIVITDNDTAGLKIEPVNNLSTTEGEETTFTMELESQPTDTVTFNLKTSNILEGRVSTKEVIFTPENWNQPQSIKVMGVDDGVVDGNGKYQITISEATSNDNNYNQLPGKTLDFTNNDNDIPPTQEINGTQTDEILIGTNSSDRINGNGGNDLVIGKQGYDEITTGNGQDTIFGDIINNFTYSDLKESDKIKSGGGDDIIFGGSGGDFIYGETGSDRIYGEAGDDRIWGGSGNDTVSGGMGKDIFYLAPGDGRDTIIDFDIKEDLIALSSGITYSDLSLSQDNLRTLISQGGSVLAVINNVGINDLTQDSFIVV